MRSLSEIETATKRATRAVGFSWGNSEEVGKCIRLLELFGLPGIQTIQVILYTFQLLLNSPKKNLLL